MDVLIFLYKNPLKVGAPFTLRGMLLLAMVVFLFILQDITAFVDASNHQ